MTRLLSCPPWRAARTVRPVRDGLAAGGTGCGRMARAAASTAEPHMRCRARLALNAILCRVPP